jgi:hypothetical protein
MHPKYQRAKLIPWLNKIHGKYTAAHLIELLTIVIDLKNPSMCYIIESEWDNLESKRHYGGITITCFIYESLAYNHAAMYMFRDKRSADISAGWYDGWYDNFGILSIDELKDRLIGTAKLIPKIFANPVLLDVSMRTLIKFTDDVKKNRHDREMIKKWLCTNPAAIKLYKDSPDTPDLMLMFMNENATHIILSNLHKVYPMLDIFDKTKDMLIDYMFRNKNINALIKCQKIKNLIKHASNEFIMGYIDKESLTRIFEKTHLVNSAERDVSHDGRNYLNPLNSLIIRNGPSTY